MFDIIKRYQFLFFFLLLFFAAAGCEKTTLREDPADGQNEVYITVSAYASSINTDTEFWEDRVDDLRMVVFGTDGSVVFNDKLYFPNGFNSRSKSVKIRPGTYDFLFIANEGVYSGDFVNALMQLTAKSQLDTDPRFRNLAYDPDFLPDGTTSAGRFVMSAVYDGITVDRGGTLENPVRLSLPTGKVELIRALAKVEVVFRKRVSGSSVTPGMIGAVTLSNVAANLSVPPLDDYYTGDITTSDPAVTTGFQYDRDSIGSVVFYVPEFLTPEGSAEYTTLNINTNTYPVRTLDGTAGMLIQRRTVPAFSENSVVRNYHYLINAYINAAGGLEIETVVKPWRKERHTYLFDGDFSFVIPPVIPTDSSLIIGSDCGRIELHRNIENLPQGLYGAYHDQIDWSNNRIIRGEPPYYCEQKYGEGWRLINSCELMSYLAALDLGFRVWTSNTWNAANYLPIYPIYFRQMAQVVLESLTDLDLSDAVYTEGGHQDNLGANANLPGVLYTYFSPGDILLRTMDFPDGWPYPGQPGTSIPWMYNEVSIQLITYWTNGYITLTDRNNWDTVLYSEFFEYTYSSTRSRCVREVE